MSNVLPDQQDTEQTREPITTRLPFVFARRHGILIKSITETPPHSADIVCRTKFNSGLLSEVRRFINMPITIEMVDAGQFDQLLQASYEQQSSQTMEMMTDLGDEMDLSSIAEQLREPEDLLESEDDAPIIRLINALLTEAIKESASDIHIEPYETRLSVRIRVDGVLREVLSPAREIAPLLVSRVKVMAKLDIAEKRLPQDGRISLKIAGRAVDVRVSTLPSGHGERVVLRILDKQAGRLDLEHLGATPQITENLDQLIHKPHGIILVTGPTGSGKTTTLYAALTRLNNKTRNIMTVEDPIEYYLDGISQTQVNSKIDMTFARGLRSILRQDPDVVMVGEIRDLETSEIAIQASLTGHLVLSTLHTNTAVGAITRMRDMGVEPFLISSGMLGIVAQRLVRILCVHCKAVYTPSTTELAALNIAAPSTEGHSSIYENKGCSECNYTGYRGRRGIFELVTLDHTMHTMIHDGISEQKIEDYARTMSPSIYQDGIRLVLAGETSLEELMRVTHEDS